MYNSTSNNNNNNNIDSALTKDVRSMDLHTLQRSVEEKRDNELPAVPRAELKRIPEVLDDYIRNFLIRNGMTNTLECFEVEWYERFGSSANHHTPLLPDNYLETAALLNKIEVLEHDLRQHAELTTEVTKKWTQAKKDKDFHRTNHNRVVQENNNLRRLLKQANGQAQEVSPAVTELKQRYDAAFKARSMMALERDKLEKKVNELEKEVSDLRAQLEAAEGEPGTGKTAAASRKTGTSKKRGAAAAVAGARAVTSTTSTVKGGGSSSKAGTAAAADDDGFVWPPDERPREGPSPASLRAEPTSWAEQSSFVAHAMPVTKIAVHPRKPAVASCSDDGTWRLSTLPQGEVILAGEGHKNWIASVAMHPHGTMVATASGDKTVKVWDFATNSCALTLTGHTDGVWSVDFQETGLLLASGGLDHTARLWDLEVGKCRRALRGHVEAVNSVRWQPFTNVLVTGSGDKTVSLWDSRMNCCAQTLYGHRSAVLAVATVPSSRFVASCDGEGRVLVWDTRKMEQQSAFECGPYPANHVAVDASERFIAVASDDSEIKMLDLVEGSTTLLTGHEAAVQCVCFDPSTNNFLVSCGSDRTVRYWS